MLSGFDAITMVAVKDLPSAKRFYQETLGFAQHGPDNPQVVGLRSGNTIINVYQSEYAGTNKATTAMWVVGAQLDSIVSALRAKGVNFEHYDLPGTSREGDVHVFGELRVAWFKDPSGNILSIQNL